MDLFKIIEKLLSANSPTIVIFSLILIYLFHKILIGPKIDAILQNTEKSKSIQDIDKIKEYISDKTNVITEKISSLVDEVKDLSQKLIELTLTIDHINENIITKQQSQEQIANELKYLLNTSTKLLNDIREVYENAASNDKVIEKITKSLAKTIFNLNDIIKKIEEMVVEIKAQNKEDNEYFELMKKKQEIEEQLRKKRESLSNITSKFSTNLYSYIDESNLLDDEDIQRLLNSNSKE